MTVQSTPVASSSRLHAPSKNKRRSVSAPPDDIEQESNGDDAEWVNEEDADADVETPMEVETSASEESDSDSDLDEDIKVVVHGESNLSSQESPITV